MASWCEDKLRDDRRDWAKYEKPDPESAEDKELRLAYEAAVARLASTGGVVKR